tara:strand:+ start:671 stop:811 length:141 start_codon:yes stop_codon:yes gene_type:complete
MSEFFKFLKERKKYWLIPMLVFLFLFGGLVVLSQGSAVAPFIYTLF